MYITLNDFVAGDKYSDWDIGYWHIYNIHTIQEMVATPATPKLILLIGIRSQFHRPMKEQISYDVRAFAALRRTFSVIVCVIDWFQTRPDELFRRRLPNISAAHFLRHSVHLNCKLSANHACTSEIGSPIDENICGYFKYYDYSVK